MIFAYVPDLGGILRGGRLEARQGIVAARKVFRAATGTEHKNDGLRFYLRNHHHFGIYCISSM